MNSTNNHHPALLLLADGKVFSGFSPGKPLTATGEICFNTGMTGYQEIFTDPSYFGQIVVTTHVHIGNYGVKSSDQESSAMKISGLVCKDFSEFYSRMPADGNINNYFQSQDIPVITGIDTRELVRYIRDKGAMNAIISSEILDVEQLKQKLQEVPSMEGLELSSKVSTNTPYTIGSENADFRVALLDLGVKKSIATCLADRGCFVKVFNARASFSEMQEFNAHGYMISNGPGDPASMEYAVDTVKEILLAGVPLFGICLGHQIFAKAMGIGTYKMFNGHRGINHPIKNLETGLCEVTSQNHGFAINEEDVNNHQEVQATHVHLNDHTIAGIRLKNGKAFSVQYHPEASPGPHDSRYLFDNFINQMKENAIHVSI
ncbi:MAG: glutamine-hydrolyzing carbamoyl-phosphate synthase small subunit [Bacteroidia bacterium]